MDAGTLVSGIREMIAAAVRQATAATDEEKKIAGELYTVNERVVSDGITHLFETNKALANAVKLHRHPDWRA